MKIILRLTMDVKDSRVRMGSRGLTECSTSVSVSRLVVNEIYTGEKCSTTIV